MSDALVLAGAAAKGAFTAGALAVLSDPAVAARLGLDVRRIVGTSSGALCGAYYAAAIHAGQEAHAGARLADVWIERGSAADVLEMSPADVLSERGFSSQGKLWDLLRGHLTPAPGIRPVELRLVVTNAGGDLATLGGGPATTFERVVDLAGDDFETAEGLDRVAAAAVASAALPGLYRPASLGPLTQLLDGGIVDNAPLSLALCGAPAIDRVFVIAPFARVQTAPRKLRGVDLVSQALEMLVGERLFRELRRAERVNRVLAALEGAVPDAAQRARVLDALEWTDRRPVRVIEIRPAAALEGNALSGFWSRRLRESYVEAGKLAAERAAAFS